MTSVPVWRVVVLGAALLAAVVAGALIADEAGDAGELVLFGAHPITRATTTAKTSIEAGSRMRGVELGAVIGMAPHGCSSADGSREPNADRSTTTESLAPAFWFNLRRDDDG